MTPETQQQQTEHRIQQSEAFSMLDSVVSETERAARDRVVVQRAELELNQRFARAFAQSGLFADIAGGSEAQQIARALIKIELGKSMGFSPAESMTGIDIIKGRVSVGANLRASRMQRAGYTWAVLQLDDQGCRLELFNSGQKIGEVAFGREDAKRANLDGKENYRQNPRNMFFARAITNAQRWYAPGILSLDILSAEEAIDATDYVEKPAMQARTEARTEGLPEKMARVAQPAAAPRTRAVAPEPGGSPIPSPEPKTALAANPGANGGPNKESAGPALVDIDLF